MYDIIIVGAGTAGMTAAIYAARAGKKALILEQENFGGQITYSNKVENFPSIKEISGMDFANNLFEQATALGAEFSLEKVKEIRDSGKTKTVVTDDGEHETKAVVLATGVKSRRLGVANEQELTGRGISYCAVCDGAFFKGKEVAVIGGGNTALQDAIWLSALCSKVYLVHRRSEFRGEKKLSDTLKTRENVEFVLDSTVSAVAGENTVQSITVKNVNTGVERTIALQGVFVAVGQIPDNQKFQNLVDTDEAGFIISGEDCKTKTAGVFAAGDCRTKEVRQLTTAAADGAVAALEACKYTDSL